MKKKMSSELVSPFFLASSFSFAYFLGRDHQRTDLLGFPALILSTMLLPTRLPRSDVFAQLKWLYVNVQTNQRYVYAAYSVCCL